ncbi:MAG: DUF6745 domain-containing protein [Cyanobacteria bacterium P01_A01_bin.83]
MMINSITEEQKTKTTFYHEKWLKTKLEYREINQNKVYILIKNIYDIIDINHPNIIFCNNPYESLKKISAFSNKQLGYGAANLIDKKIFLHLKNEIRHQLNDNSLKYLWFELYATLEEIIVDNIENVLWCFIENKIEENWEEEAKVDLDSILWIEHQLSPKTEFEPETEFTYNCISSNVWSSCGSYFDFCISVLNCNHSDKLWLTFKMFSKSCGWIFPYEKVCVVSAPPKYIRLDKQQLLHAEHLPAIEFLDGFSLFANHGEIV